MIKTEIPNDAESKKDAALTKVHSSKLSLGRPAKILLKDVVANMKKKLPELNIALTPACAAKAAKSTREHDLADSSSLQSLQQSPTHSIKEKLRAEERKLLKK